MRTISALVGKAYSAAGQAAACLHTMGLIHETRAAHIFVYIFRKAVLVMNLVYEFPLTPHQRSLAHHIDSCTTLTVALHIRLQFPSSFALITHTADCTDHTPYINHELPLPLCRVLFSV